MGYVDTFLHTIFPCISTKTERNYIKKTNRGEMSQDIFEKACVAIEKDSVSLGRIQFS